MIKRKQFPQFLAPYCIAFERSVGAVVFHKDRDHIRYLLIKYRNGHWEFPRGKMEDDEMELDTARREIVEETGLVDLSFVDGQRTMIRFTYMAHGKERAERIHDGNCILVHKKAIFYIAQTNTADIHLSQEHHDFRWLPYDAADTLLTYDNAKRVLHFAHSAVTAM